MTPFVLMVFVLMVALSAPVPNIDLETICRSAVASAFYRLEDDKFTEVWDLTDMDAVIRQIVHGEVHR